ncbi:MAG: FAD-dependent oxidoreductase [Patescibacteria group bacterium]
MKSVDSLIVGGSAAGTTAAEVIRSLKPESSITIVTDENHEQYSRVLLPHYIRHKVTREQGFLKKPEWYQDKLIELIKGTKVTKLDSKGHKVTLSSGEEYQYGKLLIAIGGYVVKLKVPGADLTNILYMRTIEDADRIIEAASKSKKAVIVGGGFIGLEFCSGFKMNGVEEVTVLVREPYYWEGKLDEESSKVLVNTLGKNGVTVLVNEEVEKFVGDGKVKSVVTKSGKTFEVDVVGVGIGIKSNLSWLEGSGIEINRAIVTNEYLETNLPDVYAAGDCAEFYDVTFDRKHIMGNWANATSQGSAVGKTMAGVKTVFETASSYSINFFDGSCSFIGVTDDKFADEVISRGSVGGDKMTRIFVKTIDGSMRIVGATIINNPAEVSPLTSAVKGKVDIASSREKLADPNFDLKNLIS